MANEVWEGFLDTISGEEKLLKKATYAVEVVEARPFIKQGEVQRGIFVDLKVIKGPEKNTVVNTYIAIPEVGNRKQGWWYAKKMKGFGDLSEVYSNMPEDLLGGLEVLCNAITGREIYADIGPGSGDYSNRNSLVETKQMDPVTPAASVASEVTEGEDTSTVDDSDDPGF